MGTGRRSRSDRDETCAGPFEWDVKRLAASIAIAGRERGFGSGDRRRALESTGEAYREAMRDSPACATSTSGTRGSTSTR